MIKQLLAIDYTLETQQRHGVAALSSGRLQYHRWLPGLTWHLRYYAPQIKFFGNLPKARGLGSLRGMRALGAAGIRLLQSNAEERLDPGPESRDAAPADGGPDEGPAEPWNRLSRFTRPYIRSIWRSLQSVRAVFYVHIRLCW